MRYFHMLAASASLVIGFIPAASAQTLKPQVYTEQVQTQAVPQQDSGVWAAKIRVEKIAEGLWVSPKEWDTLLNYGCAVGPQGLVADFLAKMEEKGHTPCSPKWYGGLSKVNKEGTQLFSIRRSPSGYMVAESDKGINLTPNHGQWDKYTLDSRSIGRPVTTEGTASANGKMVMAEIAKGLTSGAGSGFFATGLNKLLGDDCGGNCGSQFYIAGGTAVSGANAQNATLVDVDVRNANANANAVSPGSGTCSTGTCPGSKP